jgi:hypothetical protein
VEEGAVSLLGLGPTLLRLAGFVPPGARVDVARELFPTSPEGHEGHFRLIVDGVVGLGMVRGSRKWIYTTAPDGRTWRERYDLSADPDEKENLADDMADEDDFRSILRRNTALEKLTLRAGQGEVTEDVEEALRGLGYLR